MLGNPIVSISTVYGTTVLIGVLLFFFIIFVHQVYDVSQFLSRHPGGSDILIMAAGRDVTITFECYHAFSELLSKLGSTMEVVGANAAILTSAHFSP